MFFLFFGFFFANINRLWSSSSDIEENLQNLKLVSEAFYHILNGYVDGVDSKEVIYGAVKGMTSVLDPFSQFLDPDQHGDMKVTTHGEFGGVGIRIQMRDGWLTVITPIGGTPAYYQGVLPNDKIIAINQESTKGVSLKDLVKKLRGDLGTKVTITVYHEESKENEDITIVREKIKIPSVQHRVLEGNIGYIYLSEFNQKSGDDMKAILKNLVSQDVQSLVLDLRNNPGGLLSVAIQVADLFLNENDLIVYTKNKSGDKKEYLAKNQQVFPKPLAILINQGSASGSEIVAGALQDHKRAVIVGDNSFGKASVQSVIPLSGSSAIKLTVAKYYTPLGQEIQRNLKTKKGGIQPEIHVSIPMDIEIKLRRHRYKILQDTMKGQSDANKVSSEPESVLDDDKKQDDEISDLVLDKAVESLKLLIRFGVKQD